MRRIPNFYRPTEDDRHVYRLWVRWLAVVYGSIVLIVVAVLALRANQPVNQADAAAATFASAGTVHNVTRPR